MGGFLATPLGTTPESAAPPQAAPAPSPMDTLMGPMGQSPQQAEMEAQAGALNQLRQMEMALGTLSQLTQQMAAAYPGGAEPARQVMASLDQAKQALLGMLIPMMSGMPDAQSRGPTYMGG